MFRKKIRRVFAFLCAAILITSQFAVAAYACPQIFPSTALTSAEEAEMPPDCARQMESKPSPLCKAHCDQSAQTNQVPALDLLPFAWVGLWVVSRLEAVEPPSSRVFRDRPAWLTDASPPLRIQYQVFRI